MKTVLLILPFYLLHRRCYCRTFSVYPKMSSQHVRLSKVRDEKYEQVTGAVTKQKYELMSFTLKMNALLTHCLNKLQNYNSKCINGFFF